MAKANSYHRIDKRVQINKQIAKCREGCRIRQPLPHYRNAQQ